MKLKLYALLAFCITMSSASFAQDSNIITSYLKKNQAELSLTENDVSDWVISDSYKDASSGLYHTYIQQRYKGVLIYNAIGNFLIRENSVLNFQSRLIDHLDAKANSNTPVILPEDAIRYALRHLEKPFNGAIKLLSQNDSLKIFEYDINSISTSPVRVQLVYREINNKLLLAWDVSIDFKNDHWLNVRVNANDGSYIDKNDFTDECFNGSEMIAPDSEDESMASLSVTATVPQYNVFALPVEAPSFGNRTLLIDPSDPVYSPYTWQDTNGVAGAEFTITRGNNVYAYEDANNDNLPGYSPDGGSSLNFDFPFTPNAAPLTNRDAAITNLFYTCNRIHDYLYGLGFSEAAGNFQQKNYSNSGRNGDYVKAEAIDGSGSNNANFSTPPDGYSGRMQMYLWDGNAALCSDLTINSGTFSEPMTIGTATFSAAGSVTANLILVNDGTGTVTDACSPIVNNITGNIALIDRGTCNFINKAQAAQSAGAVGVIIANNVSGAPPTMPGSPTLSIPCVSISLADGNTLKSALSSGAVAATINTCAGYQIDASLDNGVIIHEYGHGLSNRLTGGPSHSGCLENAEQGGEGWSDWLALVMTIEPGDQGANARGMATFADGQVPGGPGIRRYPYSTNMSINPQTYGNIALNPEVHRIGEIWCDAIWDMTWFLIDQYGFSNDPSNPSAGNNIAIRLVLEGMKLQPCGPGFLDARDAILTADAVLYNNAHRCILWNAFARRGMGFNASQGSANVAGDEIENFELPPFCLPASQQPSAEFSSDVSTVTCGKSVKFTDASADAFEWLWNFGDMTTSSLQNPLHTFTSPGTYSVKLIVTNPLGSDSVIHTIIVDPAFSVSVTADPTDICKGEPVHLSASASGTSNRSYIVQPISYAPLSNTGTSVTLSDDQMSTAKPIGFTFNFFGLDYTQFYICSNGFITFSPSMPAAPVYGEAIPFTADPDNIIALAWNDLNPQNAGSSIRFYTTGIAPSRKLVVTYSTSHYGGVSYPFVVQAILYEGTNVIEIHTTTISNASSFDEAALTTQGIENADGSAGVAVPGRNGELFSAANDAYRFTPFISYAYNWMPGSLTGANQTVTPQSTGYYQIQVTDGTSCVETFQTQLISVTDDCLKLNLKVFIEGYYSGSGVMRAVLQNQNVQGADGTTTDTITAELHSDADPTNIMSSEKVLLGTDGKAACKFTGVSPGIPYWLVVRHRNGLETWSSSTLTLDTTGTIYDFSTSSSKAFGNNMTDVFSEGIWSIYTGDLNNDQFIDIFDFPEYDSDNQNFVSGVYVATDFNGDGFVDIFDFPVYDANNQNFVMTIKP